MTSRRAARSGCACRRSIQIIQAARLFNPRFSHTVKHSHTHAHSARGRPPSTAQPASRSPSTAGAAGPSAAGAACPTVSACSRFISFILSASRSFISMMRRTSSELSPSSRSARAVAACASARRACGRGRDGAAPPEVGGSHGAMSPFPCGQQPTGSPPAAGLPKCRCPCATAAERLESAGQRAGAVAKRPQLPAAHLHLFGHRGMRLPVVVHLGPQLPDLPQGQGRVGRGGRWRWAVGHSGALLLASAAHVSAKRPRKARAALLSQLQGRGAGCQAGKGAGAAGAPAP